MLEDGGKSIKFNTIEQIKKTNPFIKLNDAVYNILETQIVSGKIEPGSKLNTKRIAEDLGVSITPVRNAIQQLVENGLVYDCEESNNCYALNISDDSLIEVFTTRKVLEGSSAYICAQRNALINFSSLYNLAEDYRQLWRDYANGDRSIDNRKKRLNVDREFHILLFEYAENKHLIEFNNTLDKLATHSLIRTLDFWECENFENIIILSEQHLTICKAIESGIPDIARKAAEDHMEFCIFRCLINRKTQNRL